MLDYAALNGDIVIVSVQSVLWQRWNILRLQHTHQKKEVLAMDNLKEDCLNWSKCVEAMVYGMLADIGGRHMEKPTCENCNGYIPKERDEEK